METQYGPSINRKENRKQAKLRELFGTDSECDETTIAKPNNSKQNLLIKLHRTNDEIEPKTNLNVQTSVDEQKIEAQPQQNWFNLTDSESEDVLEITIDNEHFNTPGKHTHTFKSPTKPTNTIEESLTPTVKRHFSQTIRHVTVS